MTSPLRLFLALDADERVRETIERGYALPAAGDLLAARSGAFGDWPRFGSEQRILVSQLKSPGFWYKHLAAVRHSESRLVAIADRPMVGFRLTLLVILGLLFGGRLELWIAGRVAPNPSWGAALLDQALRFCAPLIAMVLVPWFYLKEVVGHFLLRREPGDKPWIAVQNNGRITGIVYWDAMVKRIRRVGSTGYAFHEFAGIPGALYQFPLAMALMSVIGFRWLFLLGWLLLGFGMVAFGNAWNGGLDAGTILTLVWLLAANVLWEHVSIGAYEIIAWGIGAFGLAMLTGGQVVISGILFGFCALAHLGVASLWALVVPAVLFWAPAPMPVLVLAVAALLTASPWLIPYLACRRELTRERMITEEIGDSKEFDRGRLIQIFVYAVFAISVFACAGSWRSCWLALVPLFVAWANVKLRWVFSPYTVTMFQLVGGTLALLIAWHPLPLFLLACFAFLPPNVLSWPDHGDRFFYSLELDSRSDLLSRLEGLLGGLPAGCRVAFEYRDRRAGRRPDQYSLAMALSWFLADRKVEVFNSGICELVKFDLFERTARRFNHASPPDEMRQAILDAGVTHLIVFTPELTASLEERGYHPLRTCQFEEMTKGERSTMTATLFEVPFENPRCEGPATVDVADGRLTVQAAAPGRIRLKYSCHDGLRAIGPAGEVRLGKDDLGYIFLEAITPGSIRVEWDPMRLLWGGQ